ncbi:hypothetical protein KC726_03540 [Candidatus Woesebacteria bacterium]|nr:hypothetical protein [Candidatus Woesebacteria bacterium]
MESPQTIVVNPTSVLIVCHATQRKDDRHDCGERGTIRTFPLRELFLPENQVGHESRTIIFPCNTPSEGISNEQALMINRIYDLIEAFHPGFDIEHILLHYNGKVQIAMTDATCNPLYLHDALMTPEVEKEIADLFPTVNRQTLTQSNIESALDVIFGTKLGSSEHDGAIVKLRTHMLSTFSHNVMKTKIVQAIRNCEDKELPQEILIHYMRREMRCYCEKNNLFNPDATVKEVTHGYMNQIKLLIQGVLDNRISTEQFNNQLNIIVQGQLRQSGPVLLGGLVQKAIRDSGSLLQESEYIQIDDAAYSYPVVDSIILSRLTMVLNDRLLNLFRYVIGTIGLNVNLRWMTEMDPIHTSDHYDTKVKYEWGKILQDQILQRVLALPVCRPIAEETTEPLVDPDVDPLYQHGLFLNDEDDTYVCFPVGKTDGFSISVKKDDPDSNHRHRLANKFLKNKSIKPDEAEYLLGEILNGNIAISILEVKTRFFNENGDGIDYKSKVASEISHYILMIFRMLFNHGLISLNPEDTIGYPRLNQLLSKLYLYGTIIDWPVLLEKSDTIPMEKSDTIPINFEILSKHMNGISADFFCLNDDRCGLLAALTQRYNKYCERAKQQMENGEVYIATVNGNGNGNKDTA